MDGQVISTFKDFKLPFYLSSDSEGHVLVADCFNDRILLLNRELHLLRVLLVTNDQVELWQPTGLCYNEQTSQLYVLHSSSGWWSLGSSTISLFQVR